MQLFFVTLILLVYLAVLARVLLREEREPAARLAWIVCILAVPLLGAVLYLLIGEPNIGWRRFARLKRIAAGLPAQPAALGGGDAAGQLPDRLRPSFARAAAVGGGPPVGGNRARLLPDSDAAVTALIADIDAARTHVHLLFYIWLPDGNGLRLAAAVQRAAGRGVACRCLVDAVGSKALTRHPAWAAMAAAGVQTARAFPIHWLRPRLSFGRVDIRNHRKIAVIDGTVTWCGSQNIADPAFLPKARFGPWVDLFCRFDGPVAWQNQRLFAADWQLHAGEDITAVLSVLPSAVQAAVQAGVETESGAETGGGVAVAMGTGPAEDSHATPDVVQGLLGLAQRHLAICTPYFVPDDALFGQICAAAVRGVTVDLILPARNDSRIVALASRSFYRRMLAAGVRLHEYGPGLLHAKLVLADGEVALIGSANLDRRSFDLNFENVILTADPGLCAALAARHARYLADSRRVTAGEVAAWRWPRRLLCNLVGTMGPLL